MSAPASYAAQMKALLVQQFQTTPRLHGFLAAVAGSFDEFEREAQRVLYLRSLDLASGVQLDLMGDLLGEPRSDRGDPEYRLELTFLVMQNVLQGTPNDFIRLVQALAHTGDVAITENFPASFTLTHTGDDVLDLANRIRPLIPAGVGPVTLVQPGGTEVLA